MLSHNKSMIRLFTRDVNTDLLTNIVQHKNFIESHFIYQRLLIDKINSIIPYVNNSISNNNFDEEYVVG